MAAHLVVAMWFQGTDVAASSDTIKVIMWAVCIIALGSLAQLLFFVGAGIAAFKAYTSATKALTEMKGRAYPLIGSVQGVVEDVRPKVVSITESVRGIMEDARPKVASVTENVRSIVDDATPKIKAMTDDVKTISSNFVDTSVTIKEKAKEIADNVSQTVDDANQKTRAQVGKVDHMVSSAFTATGEVAAKIHHGIKVPVNEVVGWVNGAKASLDKFMSHQKSEPKATETLDSGSARTSASSSGRTAGPNLVESLLGVFRKKQSNRGGSNRRGSNAAETLARSGFPETGAGSGRGSSAEQVQAVAAQAADQDVLSDPSSTVAPSPGAQEVVDRFRESMRSVDKTKPV